MPDREKVIEGLEKVWDAFNHMEHELYADYVFDALALLKEQEAVEPKQVDLYGKDDWYGLVCVCPHCKAEWMGCESETHFCPNCGQAVKWE
jgi:hypothetical protein